MMITPPSVLKPILHPHELARLAERKSWRAVMGIGRVYGLLVLSISLALWFGGLAMVVGFFLVAALQHALSILQHEAVHGLLFRQRRLNDWVGTYLLSYPIGFSLDYRLIHFAHHRYLGEEGDPDLHNYRPFPATRREVVIKIMRECSGVGAALQLLGSGKTTSGARSRFIQIMFAQMCIFGLFAIAGHPFGYLWLWLLPLGTFAKGFAQLRNIAEHFIRSEAPHGTERLRTFRSSCLERFFLAPVNFHYHAEHHWYTNIPYYHLPALRELLQSRPGFAEYAELSPSYISVLRRLVHRPSFSL